MHNGLVQTTTLKSKYKIMSLKTELTEKQKALHIGDVISILSEILYLSNIEYCQSSGDLQGRLEEINELIYNKIPDIEEADEEEI